MTLSPSQRDTRDERKERGLQPRVEGDSRSQSQRDRDRLIYTAALRRLAGVTQVAGAAEGHVFHNRLTHTLKVAQIARRLAERLEGDELATTLGGIDPEVVEAAALAHDLGHPPFGHIAEHELDRLVKLYGDEEGYEGNAQSFRIVTRLAAHHTDYAGLDLTRATLNAILKYPWRRALGDEKHKHYRKFGYYTTEQEYFDFARKGYLFSGQSVEAGIMDIADAIAYSVHDLDDFYRAGLVPLFTLRSSANEFKSFLDGWKADNENDATMCGRIDAFSSDFRDLLEFWPADRQHTGSRQQRRLLRWHTSKLIDRFVRAVSLRVPRPDAGPVELSPQYEMEVEFLQQIVRRYVINNPRLSTQQAGQTRIIAYLYRSYHKAIRTHDSRLIPPGFVDDAQEAVQVTNEKDRKRSVARVAADIVASLSDAQAQLLCRRMSGVATGSVGDILDG